MLILIVVTSAIEIKDRIHFMSFKKENMVINLDKINREKAFQDINGKQTAFNVSMKDGDSYQENVTVVMGYFQRYLHLLSQLLELIVIVTAIVAVVIKLMEVAGVLQRDQVKEV